MYLYTQTNGVVRDAKCKLCRKVNQHVQHPTTITQDCTEFCRSSETRKKTAVSALVGLISSVYPLNRQALMLSGL